MNVRRCIFIAILLLFVFSSISYSQEETSDFSDSKKWSAGLGFEYFKSTMSWDEDSLVSPLKSYLMSFHVNYEIIEGLNLGAIVGYASSDYESLIFNELPVSLELDKGAIGGFLFGGEVVFTFYRTENFDFSVMGQYIYYNGGEKQWDIPGLAVEGTAAGKSKWSRVILGGTFRFLATEPLYPYLSIAYSPLWGTFSMEESIQTLNRTEEKEISSKGNVLIGIGGIYEFSDSFSLILEADLVPYSGGDNYDGGVDFGAALRIMYSF
jgi:hypothetical protein